MKPKSTIIVCSAALLAAGVWFVWLFVKAGRELEAAKLGAREVEVIEEHLQRFSAAPSPRSRLSDDEVVAIVSEKARSAFADALIERLLRAMLAQPGIAIGGEAVLTFADEAAFERLVRGLRGSGSAVRLLGALGKLRAVRLGYDDIEDLRALLAGLDGETVDVAANFLVRIPIYPAAYEDVIAVAASDAQGEHLEFSNAGEAVDIAAPGLGVDAAWPNGQMVEFSGTSASAPFVSGAIAAVMAENPALTPNQAWALLRRFVNEAGAPGDDPELGQGNLNLGRLMERGQPGIYDIAVTGHYYDPEATEPGHLPGVQVTVQNRGTELLPNVRLDVTSGALQRNFFIPLLRPGQISTHEIPLDLRQATAVGEVEVRSEIILPHAIRIRDRSPADNSLDSRVSLAGPETAAK